MCALLCSGNLCPHITNTRTAKWVILIRVNLFRTPNIELQQNCVSVSICVLKIFAFDYDFILIFQKV
jgi:hypothetical protein